MKKVFVIIFAFLFSQNHAQKAFDSKISSVKVYRKSAEITRKVNTKLIAGKQTIVLTGISTTINPASLQVQTTANGSITLLSAKYERNYILPTKVNPEHQKLKDQMEILNDEISWINDQHTIYTGMEDVLNKNKDLGGSESGFTPNQVAELTEVYKTKLFEIKKEQIKLLKESKAKSEEKNMIQNQLNEMNARFNKPSGNIILQVSSESVTNTNFKCTYVVNNAGWNPQYDLRSEGIDKNVTLNYKSNVYQNTGQDWEDVQMTVSTGNPSLNNDRPILRPLYTNYYVAHYNSGRGYDAGANKKSLNYSNMAYESVPEKEYKDGFKYDAQATENQLSVEFEISHKQNVVSDAKMNLVPLESYQLSTTYIYHTVPKLDRGAYLLAKVSDWEKYNLVSGDANIYFEGAYVGKSYINSKVTADELLLSMGKDNNISIERKSIKEFCERKFLGANKKETFAYEISIKNKKSIPIDIEILDQIPVSQNKEIMVDLEEKSDAEYDKEIGKLLWKFNIPAGRSQKVKFIYSVKYPKDKRVSGTK